MYSIYIRTYTRRNIIANTFNIDLTKFGMFLRCKRKELNFSIEKFAEICGIDDRTLRNTELSATVPRLDTALKIMLSLNMNICLLNYYAEIGGKHIVD